MGSADVQGRLWGEAARAWSELNEPHLASVYETVFDAIGIDPGTPLLDAGCGSGLAMQLAAERGAVVTGLDASAALLSIARERIPEAELHEGDLEALPFPDGTFAAVTAFNSVQYAADTSVAAAELARVARPGAPVVALTWGPADDCETRVILAAIGGLLPPPPPGAGGPFALSEPGVLAALLAGAGLRPERTMAIPQRFEFPDLDTAVNAQLTSGPARRAIDHAGEKATRAALVDAYADARRPDGTYRQDNVFLAVIARP